MTNTWTPDICIYHGNCDDGFGAAWAIWRHWPGIEFFPGVYGKPLPDATGKKVLFVDFSAKRAELDAMAQTAASIVILDHHQTAEADLTPFAVTIHAGVSIFLPQIAGMLRDLAELGRPPILAYFDMDQSGATLAWQFATGLDRKDNPPPQMLAYIEDRDLWRFSYPRTKNFSAALRCYPQDFQVWDKIAAEPETLCLQGVTVLMAHEANIEKFVKDAYWTEVGGLSVPVVNVPYHYASDVASRLLKEFPDAPFTASWFRRGDGFIQWSLRSEDHRQDVSAVATGLGGGGHRNAAGFQLLDL